MNRNEIDKFIKEWGKISIVSKMELLKQIDDKDYFIDCVINSSIYLSSGFIIPTKDNELIKKCVERANELKLYASERVNLIKAVGEEYILECLDNSEKLKLNSFTKVELIKSINDLEIAKKYLERADELKLSEKERTELDYILKLREQPVIDKFLRFNLPERMTIGIEIESEGKASKIIEDYFKFKKWKSKDEVTLRHGVEVISPILHPTDNDAKEIYEVTSLIQSVGQEITEKCGAHVHIGADYLTSKEAYTVFWSIWGNAENIIYAICNEGGTIPRETVFDYAPPMTPKMKKAMDNGVVNLESEESLDRLVDELKTMQERRFSGLNFWNIKDINNTIEFRIANGTLNPDMWIDNVNLFGGILAVSQDVVESNDKKKLEKIAMLQSEENDREKLNILLDILGVEKDAKARYVSRYEINSELIKTSQMSQKFQNEQEGGLKVNFEKLKECISRRKLLQSRE